MNIGILGAGRVGSTLGKGWAARGHSIMISSREPKSDRMQTLLAEMGSNASAGTLQETLSFGEVIVIAIGWPAVIDAIQQARGWSGKVVIDTTNRFSAPPPDSVGSAAEDIARMTGAQVVKAFNSIGADHMVDPQFDQPPTMFIAGDSESAKATVSGLVSELGLDVIDLGPLSDADLLEELARLWVKLAYETIKDRNIAFRLMRK
jgi:predicted dinucleotide-binding enzyme